MDLWIALLSATSLAFLLFISLTVRKLAFQSRSLPVTAEWIDELSVERYRPMMRLLDGGELAFLRSQPGYTPRMAVKLRRQRSQIFQEYLRSLSADFGRVCSALKLIILSSRHDRADLAGALVRHQTRFALGMMNVYCRLYLYRLGVCGVDVAGVVNIFDSMRLELRTLVPSAVAMGA